MQLCIRWRLSISPEVRSRSKKASVANTTRYTCIHVGEGYTCRHVGEGTLRVRGVYVVFFLFFIDFTKQSILTASVNEKRPSLLIVGILRGCWIVWPPRLIKEHRLAKLLVYQCYSQPSTCSTKSDSRLQARALFRLRLGISIWHCSTFVCIWQLLPN